MDSLLAELELEELFTYTDDSGVVRKIKCATNFCKMDDDGMGRWNSENKMC